MLLLVEGFCRPFYTLGIHFFNFSGSGLFLLTESYHVPAFFSRSRLHQERCFPSGWPSSTGELHCLGGPADGPRSWGYCCRTMYAFTFAQKMYRPRIALCGSSPAGQRSPPRYVTRREQPLWSKPRKVQEWKKDTDEENVKMISRVFEKRENREKAAQKKTSSARPPRSLSHQSPLDAIHPPRSKDSYQRPPGQSFRRISNKQASFRSRPSSSSKGPYVKDKKPPNSPVPVVATSPQAKVLPGETKTKARNNIIFLPPKREGQRRK